MDEAPKRQLTSRGLTRSLAILCAVMCALAGTLIWNRARERERLVSLFGEHGYVFQTSRLPDPVDEILESVGVADAFRTAYHVSLASESVDDDLVARLTELPEFRTLHLNDSGVTEKSLSVLRQLRKMGSVDLSGTRIPEEAIRRLRVERPELIVTRAYGPEFADALRECVGRGADLTMDERGDVRVYFDDEELFMGCFGPPRSWRAKESFRRSLSDESLASLAELDRLAPGPMAVVLRHPSLGNDCLSHLIPLKRLTNVTVTNETNITQAATDAFARARPDVPVYFSRVDAEPAVAELP